MIPVYRIQDDEGRGPWRPGFSKQWVEPRPDHHLLKAWPDEFGLDEFLKRSKPGVHMGCACLTIEQLRRWFTAGEYITLRGYGFRAVVMNADELVHTSDIQCLFLRNRPLTEGVQVIPLYGPVSYARG